jgi:glycosyltransferase involved in cell wall biosynthesis
VKVSIITVCFNSEQTIRDTIESVLGQTYGDIEHIIIDGASHDRTVEIAQNYLAHITKLVSEPDQGIYDAMNKGIHMATGDVIGMINSDDFYASNKAIEMVVDAMADGEFDACFGDLCYVDKNDPGRIVRYWKANAFEAGAFARGWAPPHPTFFVRRSVYERFGVFDLGFSIAADFELMMRFLEKHRIRAQYVPDVLVKMRMGGTTNRSLSNIWRQNREILRALSQHGCAANPIAFLVRKLLIRSRQFVLRSSAVRRLRN